MQDTNRLDAVLDAVEEHGLFRAPRRIDGSEIGDAVAMEGEVCADGQWVTLWLVLDSSFPLRLPLFFLRPWDALGFIPHVDQNGLICFAGPEGLVLDRRRPAQIVQEAFHRVVRVLTDGVTGRNAADFVDEFEVYWSRLPDGIAALSTLDPSDEIHRVTIATSKERPMYVAESQGEISTFYNGASIGGKFTLQNALYLPLEPGTLIIPPRPDGPFWTVEEARNALLPGLSTTNQTRLRKLTKGRAGFREYVIVKLPRPSGGATLFGILYERVGEQHPLLEGGTARRLVPLQLQRLDRSYLIQRGGGTTDLASKRVLLAGCGAVGGHLAFELARAGMRDLTLVDPDTLLPENSYRHVLGRRYWREQKVKALKAEVEAQLPYVQITAIANSIEGALADGSVNLSDYDLLVLALGNPTVDLEINERLHAVRNGPAAVFTWLEPLGIGGHALLTNNVLAGGCFECLYTPPDGGIETLDNRAAFAAPGQSFGRALSGCGSLHTPYGSVDAVQTAALAARVAIDALVGKEQGNPLLSWKGEAAAFQEAGFRLSRRYNATEDELFRHRYAYRSDRCRICSA